jgi:molybdenum cofactor cytidylyltransferase
MRWRWRRVEAKFRGQCRQGVDGKSSIRRARRRRLPGSAPTRKSLPCNHLTMVRSVILAAGASSRMGRPKAALPVDAGGETFLSRIVSTLIAARLPEIIVVSGAAPAETRAAWRGRDRRVHFVENAGWLSGQLSSLLVGLDAPSALPIEAAVVTLVDVPFVSPDTVRTLLRAWRDTRAPIVRPAKGDEHGHPVIFDARLFDELRRADRSGGAKTVVRAHAREILNLPIDDDGAFLDVDTPEAYAQLLRQAKPLR